MRPGIFEALVIGMSFLGVLWGTEKNQALPLPPKNSLPGKRHETIHSLFGHKGECGQCNMQIRTEGGFM